MKEIDSPFCYKPIEIEEVIINFNDGVELQNVQEEIQDVASDNYLDSKSHKAASDAPSTETSIQATIDLNNKNNSADSKWQKSIIGRLLLPCLTRKNTIIAKK